MNKKSPSSIKLKSPIPGKKNDKTGKKSEFSSLFWPSVVGLVTALVITAMMFDFGGIFSGMESTQKQAVSRPRNNSITKTKKSVPVTPAASTRITDDDDTTICKPGDAVCEAAAKMPRDANALGKPREVPKVQ